MAWRSYLITILKWRKLQYRLLYSFVRAPDKRDAEITHRGRRDSGNRQPLPSCSLQIAAMAQKAKCLKQKESASLHADMR